MADVNRGNRPLSPFMIGPYYRPQLTSISSIMVRISGLAVLGVALLVVWWLVAAATSAEYFAIANAVLTSWFGDLVLLGATWALWYHTLGRLRHVIWDFGHCLEVKVAEKLGIGMFVGATVLTIITVLVV
ncbi:succinate dehydrogenase, cytochrome b556 subunit [Phaeobacter sp. QD34_3]|uniref:succinate dehydrogenase, cytochrome b556 subunit n=1 Tax=unclassified Phaeobacter TaxID=2621772 RepID=UPI00237FC966|nr:MULTISPECIES: succinate dehydrogenase, cytochrome b556 subunit [unclassified Phaeobacter]MDE4132882.1 succinate dehydrogenase, cytochrome b556 subunit [Phaeobacter sp. QD34_3]MDE4136325.1 succinate dehydrogenase, cytochrome b556 subunit [Phaeobacter sp. QD34_24]MDE4174752.1 succinate dehydrogenase, cytochrome b556 subunit [Phaeobacter sp. PT47_59]